MCRRTGSPVKTSQALDVGDDPGAVAIKLSQHRLHTKQQRNACVTCTAEYHPKFTHAMST